MIVLRRALELPIEKWVVDEAAKRGVQSLKLGHRYDTGWPDRIFWIPGGRPLMIEFKRPGEFLEPKQEYLCGVLRTLGYEVEIHDNRERALAAIFHALDAARRSDKRRKVSP